jgi:hypothetical protein
MAPERMTTAEVRHKMREHEHGVIAHMVRPFMPAFVPGQR